MLTGRLSTPVTLRGDVYRSVGGTSDYNELENKPTYNGHILEGDMTSESLGIRTPFINTNDVIIPTTTYHGTVSYTAVSDCVVICSICANAGSSSSISINGIVVDGIAYSDRVVQTYHHIFLKQGQTITLFTSFNQAQTAYSVYAIY